MREIKFRAWDKQNKAMQPLLSILPNMSLALAEFNLAYLGAIMEYTGLKDKNGKEIYEGDIVRIWDYGFRDGDDNREFGLFQDMGLDKVTMDRFPIYWLENESLGYEGDDLVNPEKCEVIGNIYENPELLEGK